jgi:hypothetical protein
MEPNPNEVTIKDIATAIDETLEEFVANENLQFENEADLNKFLYDPGYFQSNSWPKTNQCFYKNCTKKNVKSHTIQKSASLKYIAEDNHVLTPGFNFRIRKYELLLTGINDASTFPGFCQEHEQLFNRFEDNKDFTDDGDIRLQVYRTVCREIIANQKALRSQQYRLIQYLKFRDEKFDQLVKEKIKHLIKKEIQYQGSSYKHQTVAENFMTQKVKSTDNYLNNVLYPFHEHLLNDIEKDKMQKIYIKGMIIDIAYPCCLAGTSGFKISNKKTGTMFVNVLPYESKTYFILAAEIKNKKWLDRYIAIAGHTPFSLIAMVENWMIHNTDHWFLKPSVWNNLPDKIRQNILKEILSPDNKLPDNEPLLLIELREYLIRFYEHDTLNNSPDFIKLLNEEKKKLDDYLSKQRDL